MSADRAGEPRPLPVTLEPVAGEALDGYLERLAAINDLTNPDLVNRLRGRFGTAAFATIKPAPDLAHGLACLADLPEDDLDAATLQGLRGIDLGGLDAGDRTGWRTVAARGWAPARGTAICPGCLVPRI